MILREAPYLPDPSCLALHAGAEQTPVILHSAGDAPCFSRFSFAAIEPVALLRADAPLDPIHLLHHDSSRAFDDLKSAVAATLALITPLSSPLPEPLTDLPFAGGLLGFIAYEFGGRFERMPPAAETSPLPALHFGLYPALYAADHLRKRAWFLSRPLSGDTPSDVESRLLKLQSWLHNHCPPSVPSASSPPPIPLISDWRRDFTPSLDPSAYVAAVHRILEYLREGDVYQVNLTVRHRRDWPRDPALLFPSLVASNPAPFMAWIQSRRPGDGSAWSILSSSPELLLDLAPRGLIETRPIKGTIHRATDDSAQARALLASSKDRAEHTMIVDLERNDLGRICVPGSVAVDPFMTVESYRGLHHLVSSVHGLLRPGLDAADALAAIFPGGSITGAPKVRAMEIIAGLEPCSRGVYTGGIGWISPEGSARFNLAIRTMIHHDGLLDLFVGGGIVADSSPESEHDECRLKGEAMARALCDFMRA